MFNFTGLIILYVGLYFGLQSWLDSKTNHGIETPVPNLIGKNSNNVKYHLNGTGLNSEVLDSIYDPSLVVGTVIQQDPKPTAISGVKVKKGRKIKLRVSKPTMLVEVPHLVDKSQRFAEGVLRNRNFKYKLDYKPAKEAHGAVLEQWYKGKKVVGGQKIPIGSKIKLVIGRDEVGVPLDLPNLYGLSVVEAKREVNRMLNMDFLVGVCEGCVTADDSLNATVFEQSPAFEEGARVASGGSIVVMARLGGGPN